LYALVDKFFPVLEAMLSNEQITNSENYTQYMIFISKIFYCCIQLEMPPSLMIKGRLDSWMSMFKSILDTDLGAEMQTQTESFEEIEQLNK